MVRIWALVQVRSENSGAKAARMATISGSRSMGASPGAMARIPPSILVYDPMDQPVNMAKVELMPFDSYYKERRRLLRRGRAVRELARSVRRVEHSFTKR